MTAIDLRHDSKKRFLDAALHVIRAKGYAAARIEDICEVAGLTKGSFFHHFKGKEDLALEAAKYWGDTTSAFFSSAVYRTLADPVDRLLAYVDFRKAILQGDLPDFTCLAGTMVQEVYDTHAEIREACNKCISDHAATLQPDIEDAMRQRNIRSSWTAESLAVYTQAAIQGAFVLAKAKHNAAVATACMDHLRRYLELLFTEPKSQKEIVMNLTVQPEIVTRPEAHYVFLERVGPFPSVAPQAWQDVLRIAPSVSEHNQITGAMALYKMGPNVYRAGFSLSAPPQKLPQDVQYTRLVGGKYSRFVLTGAYSNLPEASGRVWSIVAEKQIQVRDDFAVENYLSDPKTTPEEKLVTEILIPTA